MFGVKSERWEAATVLSGSLAVEGRASGPVGIMASGEAFRGYLQRQADRSRFISGGGRGRGPEDTPKEERGPGGWV